MKTTLKINILLLVLICFFHLGCTNTVTPVNSDSTTPFRIPTNTAVASTTPRSTYTSVPTPPQIILPAVTLSVQESETALLELLKTNGGCKGKCIAGIYPDQITVQEAVDITSQWGMIYRGENSQGKTFFNLVQRPLNERVFVSLSVGTWTNKLVTIDRVRLYIGGAPGYGFLGEDLWLLYDEDMAGFRLDTILKTYGMPSYVGYFFQTTVEIGKPLEGRTIAYSMEMQYERINLIVEIGAMSFYDGENLMLCPSKDPHDLGIVINPERPMIKLQEFRSVTWQALTGTDLEEFYRLFTDEADPNACVTTTLEQIQSLQPSFR